MAYDNGWHVDSNSGATLVSNHYGVRASGGSEGITKTEGGVNEFSYDSSDTALAFGFPSPATGQDSVWVTDVYAFDRGETITALTIGGLPVQTADPATGVTIEIPAGNTGVLAGLVGSASGRIFIKYLKNPTA